MKPTLPAGTVLTVKTRIFVHEPATHPVELQAMNVNGYGSASGRAESADAGFHHHLARPVDTNELSALPASVAG